MTWIELLTLFVSLSLDFVEYIFPVLMVPIIGDMLDLMGLVFCLIYFGKIGLLSLLEIVPGLDALPLYTATWLAWYILGRRAGAINTEAQLDKWK